MIFTLSEITWFCFACVAAVQLFYYLFFFSRTAFYRKKEITSNNPRIPLSVVICAKNEENNLSKNLPAILQQRYQKDDGTPLYEVIVVNDNSEDDTKHYLRSIEPGYPHYRHIELKQEAKLIPGKKYPLSIGLKGALNETVVLTDADCKPSSTLWLQMMSEGFYQGKEIVLGYGAYYKKAGMLNKVIRYETFFSALQYFSFALGGVPYMGVGRNLAYKKELFFRHKGFLAHQYISSGDDDLFINAAANGKNTAVIIDTKAFTLSEPKTTWSSWFQQKTRHLTTGKYYRPVHKFLLGLFSASHFLFYLFFILALFYRPYLFITLGIFGLRFLIQAVIMYGSMRKLDEKDLFKYFWLFDILMCVYYFIFSPRLFFTPKKNKWK
jgi:cellulose synthase/poly-beta-1,6-N-acetylglucosamine synthase-like glycosyltransferase